MNVSFRVTREISYIEDCDITINAKNKIDAERIVTAFASGEPPVYGTVNSIVTTRREPQKSELIDYART